MGPFSIKVDDTQPSLAATLSSTAATLVGATIALRMREETTGALKVDAACVIVDAAARTVRYDWQTGDTDTAGRYRSEFVVTFADLSQETFPAKGCFFVEVAPHV